jgi:GWxTD domain-containing protein
MNLLEAWIQTPLAEALGWTLFHFLWEGAAIAALLLVALFACRPAAARLRYGLACGALLAMPLAFAITLAVSMPPAAAHFAIHPNAIPVGEWIAASAGSAAPATIPLAERLAWAGPFWLAGVIGVFFFRTGSWIAARRLRRVGTVAAPESWRLRLKALARDAGIARPVALLESCLAEVPVAMGYLRPAILAPLGMLAGLPAEQVEAILLHELAHIRRADYLVNLLQIAIEGLLFYHPALWWVSGVVRAEREHCCDDWAAAQLGNAHQYASALVTLEESPWRAPSTMMAASGSNLLRRIRRLVAKPGARDLAIPVAPSILLMVSVGVALGAWSPARPPQPHVPVETPQVAALVQAAQTAPAVATPAAGPYRKWLDEDVAYIITPEEKAAFGKLRTDPEREEFIEHFWERRNPTPESVDNPFKVEHYRRIAYANKHFASPDGRTPGWRTARGRFYIIYGPPDEIDDFSSYPHPYQIWRYRYVEAFKGPVEWKFDYGGDDGVYRMVPSPAAAFNGEADGGPALPGSHISVQVYQDGQVVVSMPRGFSAGPYRLAREIRIAKDRTFQWVRSGPALQRTLVLTPGAYVLTTNLADQSTGQTYNEKVLFEVK